MSEYSPRIGVLLFQFALDSEGIFRMKIFMVNALESVNSPCGMTLQIKIHSLNGRFVCHSFVHLLFQSPFVSFPSHMVFSFSHSKIGFKRTKYAVCLEIANLVKGLVELGHIQLTSLGYCLLLGGSEN